MFYAGYLRADSDPGKFTDFLSSSVYLQKEQPYHPSFVFPQDYPVNHDVRDFHYEKLFDCRINSVIRSPMTKMDIKYYTDDTIQLYFELRSRYAVSPR